MAASEEPVAPGSASGPGNPTKREWVRTGWPATLSNWTKSLQLSERLPTASSADKTKSPATTEKRSDVEDISTDDRAQPARASGPQRNTTPFGRSRSCPPAAGSQLPLAGLAARINTIIGIQALFTLPFRALSAACTAPPRIVSTRFSLLCNSAFFFLPQSALVSMPFWDILV